MTAGWHFRVRARDAAGQVSAWATVQVPVETPAAPVLDVGADGASITWGLVTGADFYKVAQASDDAFGIGSGTIEYFDASAPPLRTAWRRGRWFRVCARRGSGVGPWSNAVEVPAT